MAATDPAEPSTPTNIPYFVAAVIFASLTRYP